MGRNYGWPSTGCVEHSDRLAKKLEIKRRERKHDASCGIELQLLNNVLLHCYRQEITITDNYLTPSNSHSLES
jgi:hypothetical protein